MKDGLHQAQADFSTVQGLFMRRSPSTVGRSPVNKLYASSASVLARIPVCVAMGKPAPQGTTQHALSPKVDKNSCMSHGLHLLLE